jgi:opacity protein-like surface antigen
MKKIILSIAAVFAFGAANAQDSNGGGFSKGSMFLSGSVGYSSEKVGNASGNTFTFSPAFGYFITEDMALGGRLNVMSGEDIDNGDKSSEFGLEVFGRKYWTASSQFSLFGELAVGFGSGKVEDVFGDEDKYNTFGINAGIGVNYFISSAWSIEAKWAALGYNSFKYDGADDAYNTFGLGADLANISLGLNYKF